MITRESIAGVEIPLAKPVLASYLGGIELDLPSCEGYSVIHWSYRDCFATATHFWRRSQTGLRGFGGDYSTCFGISVADFKFCQLSPHRMMDILLNCLDGNPLFSANVKPIGDFHCATSLYDEWDTTIAVASIGRLYLAAYWETSA